MMRTDRPWRALLCQGLLGLLAGFGAGLLGAAVLTAAVMVLSNA